MVCQYLWIRAHRIRVVAVRADGGQRGDVPRCGHGQAVRRICQSGRRAVPEAMRRILHDGAKVVTGHTAVGNQVAILNTSGMAIGDLHRPSTRRLTASSRFAAGDHHGQRCQARHEARGDHPELLARLPALLSQPRGVLLDSSNQSTVMVLDTRSEDGRPVVAIIKRSKIKTAKGEYKVAVSKTAYPWDDSGVKAVAALMESKRTGAGEATQTMIWMPEKEIARVRDLQAAATSTLTANAAAIPET